MSQNPLSLLKYGTLLVSLACTTLALGQVSSPLDPVKPASTSTPYAAPAASNAASTTNTPQQAEVEAERQVLREESLLDNQDELQVQAASLSDMNLNALSVETEATRGRRSTASFEASGGYTTNLFNSAQNVIGSGFSRFSAPVTYTFSKPRARFIASYLPEFTLYSAASGIYQTHVYNHTLLYSLSPRTTLNWQLSGARYRDVGQFLPVVLQTGGTGVAQPTGSVLNTAGTSTVNNAATAVSVLHKLSPEDQITVTGTAAWNELAQTASVGQALTNNILRNQTFAADALYEHTVNSTTFLGVEGTAAYVRGLSNGTTLYYETVLGTIRYAANANDTFSFAAGPLIRNASSSVTTKGDSGTTYALNAQYTHRSHIATVGGGYARVIQLSLDNSSTPANQVFATFSRPITRHFDATIDMRYIHSGAGAADYNQTNFGGAVRLDYRTGTRLSWFATGSDTYAVQPATTTTTATFTRGEISGGLRFDLDRRPTR